MDQESVKVLNDIKATLDVLKRTQQGSRLETLQKLKTIVDCSPKIPEIGQDQDVLPIIVKYLSSGDQEEAALTCAIIRRVMEWLDPAECLQKYDELTNSHGGQSVSPDSAPEVIKLHIALLSKSMESTLDKYGRNDLSAVTSCILYLGNDDLSVAKAASAFLIEMSELENGRRILCSPESVKTFKQVLNKENQSSEIKFRVFDTLMDIGKTSGMLTQFNKEYGIVESLCRIVCNKEDPLEAASALELLLKVADNESGRQSLKRNGSLYDCLRRLLDDEAHPLRDLLVPGAIKFIGRASEFELPEHDLVERVLKLAISYSEERNLICALMALEAIALIGTSSEGRKFLHPKADFQKCLGLMRDIIRDSPAEFRCRLLEALAHTFGSNTLQMNTLALNDSNEDQKILPLWLNIIFPDISKLFSFVQQPFSDLRVAAFTFLTAIAPLHWAQKHYIRSPGVIEYLTSRSPKHAMDKESLEKKYEIVCTLLESPIASELLSTDDMAKLRVYRSQGVVYSEAPVNVATREA